MSLVFVSLQGRRLSDLLAPELLFSPFESHLDLALPKGLCETPVLTSEQSPPRPLTKPFYFWI